MRIYLVGGAVRDLLMNREPKDRDYVAVGATPQQLLDLGYEQVGASFPVFLHPVTRDEYALARTETKNGDGYHGFLVDFHPKITLEDDLARRDLTINSIAYDEVEDVYIDPYGGIRDLKERTLRHTSDAFADDPLRVIRLARFAARFESFTVDDRTMLLCERLVQKGELNHLPYERHAAEIAKVFDTCTPKGVETFFDILRFLKVDEHVNFYRGANMKWLQRMAKVAACVGGSAAVTLFAALSKGNIGFIVQTGGADAVKLHHLITKVRVEAPADRAEFAHDLLREAGAFQAGNKLFHLFEQALVIGHMAGEWYSFSARELAAAAALTQPVAENLARLLVAQGLEGKAIGDGIKQDRIRLLKQLFPT